MQSELYNKKVHGKPYVPGDLVWLHNPAVPPGESRSFIIHGQDHSELEKISDVDHRIKEVFSKKPAQVFHFNRLKLCPLDTHLPQQLDVEADTFQQLPMLHHNFKLELVDDDNTTVRRSTRNQHPPDFLLPQISH